jgi:hypothetical protein|tara:strand:+ start:65 stop:481 length:417 start_codon:yes stop_codon:yes gene_type:complete
MKKLFVIALLPLLMSCGSSNYLHKAGYYGRFAKKATGVGNDLWYTYADLYAYPALVTTTNGWYEALMTNGCSEIELVLVEVIDNRICAIQVQYPNLKTVRMDHSSDDRVPVDLNNGVGIYKVVSKDMSYMLIIHKQIV